MAKYILVKKEKGKKFEYQVIPAESKAIVSKRTSARDYVACVADGSYYFGRLDLIGKGDHGKQLSWVNKILSNPEKAYKEMAANWVPIENNGLQKTPPNNGLPETFRVLKRKKRD